MITILTGLPGNGKTLFALWFIKNYAASQAGREVYYSGIKDLQLPWTQIEPEKWIDLPTGAIIVIDEAQTVFPKKPNGSKLPDFYEQLATHRHKGFDIFLITQHPSLVDNFVRQLAGRHFHVVRKFGLQRATIYEWSAANSTPQSSVSQKSAIPLKWGYPKEVYGYYKSAELHTVKRSIPAKLVLAVLFVISVVAFGWFVLNKYQERAFKSKEAVQSSSSGAASHTGSVHALSALDDAKRYVAMNTPRVQGLPHTAPKYDEITKPVRAPIPAVCISTAKHCKCYSQQGTPMGVEAGMCRQFASEGYFLDFNPDGQHGGERSGERVGDRSGERVVDHGGDLSSRAPESLPGQVAVLAVPRDIPDPQPPKAALPSAPVPPLINRHL